MLRDGRQRPPIHEARLLGGNSFYKGLTRAAHPVCVSFHAAAALLICLFLAACSTPSPPPASIPPPHIDPRPGVLTWSADWTPPIGAWLRCGGPGLQSPFACHLPVDARWGVLPQPGNGGFDCIDPQPNPCFDARDGVLDFHGDSPGMALVSAGTLDPGQPISVEAVVTVENDCGRGVSYMGPVIYGGGADDGDPLGTYIAAYISCAAPTDPVKLWIYRPTYAGPVNSIPVPPGAHAVRIDYRPGRYMTILLDGYPQLVVTAGSLSNDAMTFPNPPHWALWFGAVDGTIARFDVYTGP
jgi:hypothetical protein